MREAYSGQNAWILREKICDSDMPKWIKYDRDKDKNVINLEITDPPDDGADGAVIRFSSLANGILKDAVCVTDHPDYHYKTFYESRYSCIPFFIKNKRGIDLDPEYRRDDRKDGYIQIRYMDPLDEDALDRALDMIGNIDRTIFFSQEDEVVNIVQQYVFWRKNFSFYDGTEKFFNKMVRATLWEGAYFKTNGEWDQKNKDALDRYFTRQGIFDESVFDLIPERRGRIFNKRTRGFKVKMADLLALKNCKKDSDKARIIENFFMRTPGRDKPICKSFLVCPDIIKQLPLFLHHYYKTEDVEKLTRIYEVGVNCRDDWFILSSLDRNFEGENRKKYEAQKKKYDDHIFKLLFMTDEVISAEMNFLTQLSWNYRAYTVEGFIGEPNEDYSFLDELM